MGPQQRTNILASCYKVNAVTSALQGFHYSTTGAGGMYPLGPSGVPEVRSGPPSPPRSPPLAANVVSAERQQQQQQQSKRQRGAAHAITEECERLFCETLRATFLGERNDAAMQDSVVMSAVQQKHDHSQHGQLAGEPDGYFPVASARTMDREASVAKRLARLQHKRIRELRRESSSDEDDEEEDETAANVRDWVEVWDYAGDTNYSGFTVASGPGSGSFMKGGQGSSDRSLFVFLDEEMVGKDLKPGLMALIELTESPPFACSRLVVCLDRNIDTQDRESLMRDLGWVGFELDTLARWAGEQGGEILSDRWIFMGMEV
ncbi:hypothetical protein MMC25_004491 [Agyrium rufum]|nr:hypothetical protein [Agyrium rufum]